MLEMLAITYDGAHAAESKLSDLRANQDDPWLSEVSIIEHDTDGRYSVKAKNPDCRQEPHRQWCRDRRPHGCVSSEPSADRSVCSYGAPWEP